VIPPAKPATEYGRRGFTLVELLVAMAIITVLAALLLPAIFQARNRARGATCVSNLRQLSAAIQTYAQDWSDRLPRLQGSGFAGTWPTADLPNGSSATHLRAVLGRRAVADLILKCPNDSCAPEYGFAREAGAVYNQTGSSYVPWCTARAGRYGSSVNGQALGTGTLNTKTCLLRDYGGGWHGVRSNEGLKLVADEFANAAFADGHVARASVYSVETGRGRYAGACSGGQASQGGLTVSGNTDYGRVELAGYYTTSAASGESQGEMRIMLSGQVQSSDGIYEVDKVFTLGPGARIGQALRLIVSSLEGWYGA